MRCDDLSIIIYSCNKNSIMWDYFLFFFKKYWGDCPYKTVLLTDFCLDNKYSNEFDCVVECNSSFGVMIKEAIEKAKTEFVMIFMDDYFINQSVNNDEIKRVIDICRNEGAGLIQLSKSSLIKTKQYNSDLSIIAKGDLYSFSTQPGIWNASFLKNNCRDQWSAWDFERKGSLQTEYKENIFLYNNYSFPYVEVCRNGKIMPKGVKLLNKNNANSLLNYKSTMNPAEVLVMYIKTLILLIFPKTVTRIQNKLFNN